MSGNIIPFGKYKGRPIEEIARRDPQYVEWLTGQDWFEQKFATIYQVVINQFGAEPEATPEHNAMQARFLDPAYCARFAMQFGMFEGRIKDLTFEADGWDVCFRWYDPDGDWASITYFVECKPSMGDDYPAALRQMQQNRDRVRARRRPEGFRGCRAGLLIRDYCGRGGSLDQVSLIFGASQVLVVTEDDMR